MKASVARTDIRNGEHDTGTRFAIRLREAVEGRVLAQIAKAADVAPSTLQRYLGGAMPAADIAFRLARAIGVRAAWLIEGEEPKLDQLPTSATVVGLAGDVAIVPRYDLFAFGEYGKPEPAETLALPTSMLARARITAGIWVAEMPSDAFPSLAGEGELLICRDPEQSLQDRRIYVFLIDGRPIVRRVFVRPDGLQLGSENESDTMLVTPHELEAVTPIARVVSAISIHTA